MQKKLPGKVFGGPALKPWQPPSSRHLLPRNKFEPVLSRPIKMDLLATELVTCFHDSDGHHKFRTCYGDIYKVVNALMDYSKLLEMVCDEWDLRGYQRGVYEYHAVKLRAIAKRYQEAIGYDYEAAVAKCEAKKKRHRKADDIGGDALELAVKKGTQKSKK